MVSLNGFNGAWPSREEANVGDDEDVTAAAAAAAAAVLFMSTSVPPLLAIQSAKCSIVCIGALMLHTHTHIHTLYLID